MPSSCLSPGGHIISRSTSFLDTLSSFSNLIYTKREKKSTSEPSGSEGEGWKSFPVLTPDLLSNEVAVFHQGGSLIRSHRSQGSTHMVKWAEVVYLFPPSLSQCLWGRTEGWRDEAGCWQWLDFCGTLLSVEFIFWNLSVWQLKRPTLTVTT